MHQSTFRILRWTEDDRPYTKMDPQFESSLEAMGLGEREPEIGLLTSISELFGVQEIVKDHSFWTSLERFMRHNTRDFFDLFCTLMVALPLTQHIQLFSKYPTSFTTREALGHLGNLKFTQTNRRPSPDNPEVMVTTKVATTFSMVEPMARTLCTKFLSARLVEQVGSNFARDDGFESMSSIWQMSPKGIKVLEGFAHRNGVSNPKVADIIRSPRNSMNLLVLERKAEQDDLQLDPGTIDVIFRRFAGQDGPNTGSGSVHSDSDSIDESTTGLTGVRQVQRKFNSARLPVNVFSGKQVIDWLMNCCTLVDVREAAHIARHMLQYGLIALRSEDKRPRDVPVIFNNSKNAWYEITDDGKRLVKWVPGRSKFQDEVLANKDNCMSGNARENAHRRLITIIGTPGLLIHFRDYLNETHCEENLNFWFEAKAFLARWNSVLAAHTAKGEDIGGEALSEILAAAYDLYNAFLAPGSPCELNIDHALRKALVTKMSQFDLPSGDKLPSVIALLDLYDQAQSSVFKLMASDSAPKFCRDQRFRSALIEHSVLEGVSKPQHPPLQAATMKVQAISS